MVKIKKYKYINFYKFYYSIETAFFETAFFYRKKVFSKGSALTSAFFGVGFYYELLKKSIPIKRFTQNSSIYAAHDFNYNENIVNTHCSSIGKCYVANDLPR